MVEVASELEGGAPQPQGPDMTQSQDPMSMLQALTAEAKNPDELAQKLQMLEPRQQRDVLQALSRSNPSLFQKTMQAMQKLNAGGGQGGNVVDMRPMPEKLPPRREEKPV